LKSVMRNCAHATSRQVGCLALLLSVSVFIGGEMLRPAFDQSNRSE